MAEKKSEEAAFESSAFGAPPVSTAAFFFARSRNSTTAPAAAARPALLTRALRSPSLSRARAVPLDLVIVNAHRGPRARLPRGANALLPAPAAAAAAADADRGRKLWAAASGGRCCGEEMGRALCTCPCCGRLGEGGRPQLYVEGGRRPAAPAASDGATARNSRPLWRFFRGSHEKPCSALGVCGPADSRAPWLALFCVSAGPGRAGRRSESGALPPGV